MNRKFDLETPYGEATQIEVTGFEFHHPPNGVIKFNLLRADGSILQAGCEVVASEPLDGLSLEAAAAEVETGLENQK